MQESPRENRVPEMPFDVVEEASEQSFPASDAPGWAIGQRYPMEPTEASPATAPRPRHRRDEQRGRPPAPPNDSDPEPSSPDSLQEH
jgi:hypothetical protein